MKKIRISDITITEVFANSHHSVGMVQKYRKEFA